MPRKSDDFDKKYKLIKSRSSDTDFFYGVKTTGIFCRPGCSSRLSKPENTVLFDTAGEALNNGFRPCKRCRPLDEPVDKNAAVVKEICRIIEDSDEEPSLKHLAEKTGYSETYVQKIFKKTAGISPKEYAKAVKAKRFKMNLSQEASVTSAIYSSGFGSSSRVYEDSMLAMTPTQYRKGGAGLRIRMGIYPCILGYVLIAFTDKGVCSVEFGDSATALSKDFQSAFSNAVISELEVYDKKTAELILSRIQEPSRPLDIPLDIHGTIFQQKVWNELRKIPAGETRSYSDIAREIGKPESVRAVANACGSNNIALLIPCHRVLRKNGDISGYKWGVERKHLLLRIEREG